MIKYNIFPLTKPEPGQLIYAIGLNGKEELTIYNGQTRFTSLESHLKGFYAKHWRELESTEIEYANQLLEESKSVKNVKKKHK